MRKLTMAMVVGLLLATVASAVPTGPGGTIYLGNRPLPYTGPDNTALLFYYIDVDSNWDPITPVSASGAAVLMATVNNRATTSMYRRSLASPTCTTSARRGRITARRS